MITLKLDSSERLYSIPSNLVHFVDFLGEVTPLPFATPSVDGLTNFDDYPLVQIDLGHALGLESVQIATKRLILENVLGHYALRVQEVLGLSRVCTTGKNVPVQVPLEKIIPQGAPAVRQESVKPVPTKTQALTVLQVASGGKIVSLLTHNIDQLHELKQEVFSQNGQDTVLLKVKDRVLPSYSFGYLSGVTKGVTETIALVVHGHDGDWALRVEQALGFRQISEIYSSSTESGKPVNRVNIQKLIEDQCSYDQTLWHLTSEGQIQELLDANQLRQPPSSIPLPTAVLNTIAHHVAAPKIHHSGATEGVRVDCGSGSYFLPQSLVSRILNPADWNHLVLLARSAAVRGESLIPLVDGHRFLFGKKIDSVHRWVLLEWGKGQKILLAVDRATVFSRLTLWHILNLPVPLPCLFDAAALDTGRWILRLSQPVLFADLPWAIRRAFVSAIIGWITPDTFEVREDHAA
ncbi:hypothetical protein CCP3SC1AL1_280016 [Gammaproteobacteria bacterium]